MTMVGRRRTVTAQLVAAAALARYTGSRSSAACLWWSVLAARDRNRADFGNTESHGESH